MPEQLKIFTHGFSDNADALQSEVNDWLRENTAITIVKRESLLVTGVNVLGEGYLNLTILIYYTQKTE